MSNLGSGKQTIVGALLYVLEQQRARTLATGFRPRATLAVELCPSRLVRLFAKPVNRIMISFPADKAFCSVSIMGYQTEERVFWRRYTRDVHPRMFDSPRKPQRLDKLPYDSGVDFDALAGWASTFLGPYLAALTSMLPAPTVRTPQKDADFVFTRWTAVERDSLVTIRKYIHQHGVCTSVNAMTQQAPLLFYEIRWACIERLLKTRQPLVIQSTQPSGLVGDEQIAAEISELVESMLDASDRDMIATPRHWTLDQTTDYNQLMSLAQPKDEQQLQQLKSSTQSKDSEESEESDGDEGDDSKEDVPVLSETPSPMQSPSDWKSAWQANKVKMAAAMDQSIGQVHTHLKHVLFPQLQQELTSSLLQFMQQKKKQIKQKQLEELAAQFEPNEDA